MRYLRTRSGTDWPEHPAPSGSVAGLARLVLPNANPGSEGKLHLVHEWLIEFDEQGQPWREIGVSIDRKPVIAGPDNDNYGFWLDTNMSFADFPGETIAAEEFETLWRESGAQEPD